MNLLSIGAAYGVVVAIFQWGWAKRIFGVEPAPIEPFMPMMLFAIVFGLSMDYEVFLLSRIREEWDRTGDSRTSVADGLAATARVITAAAAIMVFVFGSFLLEDDRAIKLFGFGLAVAVLLDATVVRMLLVPATMELLGDKNWWLPGWLDRILPNINVEGTDRGRRRGARPGAHTRRLSRSEEPAPTGSSPEDAPRRHSGAVPICRHRRYRRPTVDSDDEPARGGISRRALLGGATAALVSGRRPHGGRRGHPRRRPTGGPDAGAATRSGWPTGAEASTAPRCPWRPTAMP